MNTFSTHMPVNALLSPRDKAIIKTVTLFKMVSSSQIRRLHFSEGTYDGTRNRQRRICARLVKWGCISRLPRPLGGGVSGSADYVYIPAGSKTRQANLHTLELTELYTQLVEGRRAGQLLAMEYDPEPYCWEMVGNIRLMPDARVKIVTAVGTMHYWAELDRSSEWRPQLNAKCRRYIAAYNRWDETVFPKVVFIVEDGDRARFLRSVINRQEIREMFDVVVFSEAVGKLCG